jgi:hypothetical protein
MISARTCAEPGKGAPHIGEVFDVKNAVYFSYGGTELMTRPRYIPTTRIFRICHVPLSFEASATMPPTRKAICRISHTRDLLSVLICSTALLESPRSAINCSTCVAESQTTPVPFSILCAFALTANAQRSSANIPVAARSHVIVLFACAIVVPESMSVSNILPRQCAAEPFR